LKLTNLGGATAILEHKGKRMLFDPWLDDGIFHGSWFHYPPLAVGIEDLGRLDYVYVSHIHEDHCSPGTIEHINRDAELIIMDRKPNFVARFLDVHGFKFSKVHLVKPRTEVSIAPDLQVNMLEADPGNEMSYMVDSALLLWWDGFTVYNANDCQPYGAGLEYVAKTYGTLDLALVPYSGGSGYPSCYVNLNDAEKLAEKRRILAARLDNFIGTVRTLDAKHVMPFADQYVVGGSRANLNQFISHPVCPGDVRDRMESEGLARRLLLLNSGQSYDFDATKKVPAAEYRTFTESDRQAYIDAHLLDAIYDHERTSFNPSIPLERLVGYARARLWEAQQRKKFLPAFTFYLDVPERRIRYAIRLDREGVAECGWDAPLEQPYLRIACNFTLMTMLLIGHVSWNIADAALFLDYERVPNVYDPEIYVYLNQLRV
jgi:UDP-MurNAc hydroxylase